MMINREVLLYNSFRIEILPEQQKSDHQKDEAFLGLRV